MSKRELDTNAIPPRWTHCPRKSDDLIAGKFIAFKTLLDSKYNAEVPLEFRFNVDLLLNSLKSRKVELGLLIDLTNTTRFYDKEEVSKRGVMYYKLNCRGHAATPTTDQVRVFIEMCDNFISKHPLKVIGVHCTHGFNRSGFMICSYLVEKQEWSIEAAVSEFSQRRPPGIYKQDYLTELFKRYGAEEDTPEAPALPSWHTECEDDDGQEEAAPAKRAREEESVPEFMEGVNGVRGVSDPHLRREVQDMSRQMCHFKGKGFSGCQPVSMSNENIEMLRSTWYQVSWKADGTRYLMLIDGPDRVFLLDRDNRVFQAPGVHFYQRKEGFRPLQKTLVDGEMVLDKGPTGATIPRFLVYDIVHFEGNDVGHCDFMRRMLCINKEIIWPRDEMAKQGKLDKEVEPFHVRTKQFIEACDGEKFLHRNFNTGLSHETDGLIFQPVDKPYLPGRCDIVLKWKPPSVNSIDFKLLIRTVDNVGQLRERQGQLFVGQLDAPFAVMKVTKELAQYNGKIVECRFELDEARSRSFKKAVGEWKLMRERKDKSFPNSYDTAQAVMRTIMSPLTEERLVDFLRHHCFRAKTREGAQGTSNGGRGSAPASSSSAASAGPGPQAK